MTWLSSAAHHRWLESETDHLLAFARNARLPEGGFGWLDDGGGVMVDRPSELWVNCRMTYCFAIGTMLGRPGTGVLADHGVAALAGRFHDDEHGGWFASVGPDGPVDAQQGGLRARLRHPRCGGRRSGAQARRRGLAG